MLFKKYHSLSLVGIQLHPEFQIIFNLISIRQNMMPEKLIATKCFLNSTATTKINLLVFLRLKIKITKKNTV